METLRFKFELHLSNNCVKLKEEQCLSQPIPSTFCMAVLFVIRLMKVPVCYWFNGVKIQHTSNIHICLLGTNHISIYYEA